jgi:hypothetical protein
VKLSEILPEIEKIVQKSNLKEIDDFKDLIDSNQRVSNSGEILKGTDSLGDYTNPKSKTIGIIGISRDRFWKTKKNLKPFTITKSIYSCCLVNIKDTVEQSIFYPCRKMMEDLEFSHMLNEKNFITLKNQNYHHTKVNMTPKFLADSLKDEIKSITSDEWLKILAETKESKDSLENIKELETIAKEKIQEMFPDHKVYSDGTLHSFYFKASDMKERCEFVKSLKEKFICLENRSSIHKFFDNNSFKDLGDYFDIFVVILKGDPLFYFHKIKEDNMVTE